MICEAAPASFVSGVSDKLTKAVRRYVKPHLIGKK